MTTAPKSPDDHCKECGGDVNKIPGHYAYCSTQKRDPVPDWEGMAKRFAAGQPKPEQPNPDDRAGREGLCPYCGGKPYITGSMGEFWISCTDCQCGTTLQSNPEKAWAVWNRRDTRSDGGGAGEADVHAIAKERRNWTAQDFAAFAMSDKEWGINSLTYAFEQAMAVGALAAQPRPQSKAVEAIRVPPATLGAEHSLEYGRLISALDLGQQYEDDPGGLEFGTTLYRCAREEITRLRAALAARAGTGQ